MCAVGFLTCMAESFSLTVSPSTSARLLQRVSDHYYIGVVGRIEVLQPVRYGSQTSCPSRTIQRRDVMGRVEHSFRECRRREWMERRAETPVAQYAIDGACAEGIPSPTRSISGYVVLGKAALRGRFEPESRKIRYQAEFQSRRKKASEGWADFADDLQSLTEKAYPSLQHEARERLAINTYLQQLTQPQVAFSVKQKNPDTLDDAVAATLEMQSYVESPHNHAGTVSTLQPETETATVAVIDPVEKLIRMVEWLTERVETLQVEA